MRVVSLLSTAAVLLCIGVAATVPTTAVPAPTAPATPIPTAPKSLVWEDLFAPPYQGLPEISMSIACVDPTLCFLPGGSNGAGFQLFSFNGQANGNLNPMNEPNMTLMIMSVEAAGTKAAPVGVFSGVGFGTVSESIQYLSKGTTWLPSTVPPALFSEVQSLRATHDGEHIIALGAGITGSVIMHSTDYGKSFTPIPFNVTLVNKNCTAAAYASMVDNVTWYVTLGNSPNNGNSNSNSQSAPASSSFGGAQFVRAESFTSSIVKNEDGTFGRVFHTALEGHKMRASQDEKCPGYTGQIAKTTDGGKTWKMLVAESSYTFAQIECTSATHCVAVGYGVVDGQTVSLIFLSTDGETFKQVYSIVSTQAESYGFQTVKFADAHEVWVGGSATIGQANYGALWYSKDGGKTWKQYADLQPNIVMIFDLSFAAGVGFAVAMTELKTATILRYKLQYFDGYFVQSNCALAGCNLCQNMTFPQGMCLPQQGGSVQAFCDNGQIVSQAYQTTSCVGSFNVTTMPINQCLNSTGGGFFENFCLSSTKSSKKQAVQKHANGMRH